MAEEQTTPLVDVFTVTFNSPPIEDAFEDLATLPGVQVTVVDNASSEPPVVPRSVRLIRRSTNDGFGAACNVALEEGAAPYILFLNPDCTLEPAGIHAMVQVARQHDGGSGAVVGARAQGAPGQRVLPAGAEPSAKAFLSQYLGVARRRPIGFNRYDSTVPDGPVPVDWVGGGCLLISRDLFARLGGFDDRFFLYGEDVDLCLRARDLGAPVVLAGDVTAHHPVGTGSTASPDLRMAWMRNLRRIVETRRGRAARRRLDAALVAGAAVSSGLRLLGRQPSLGRPDLPMLYRHVLRRRPDRGE